ncbi:MAG: PEGA domain-containing protein [Sandaracinaceae bacterium]
MPIRRAVGELRLVLALVLAASGPLFAIACPAPARADDAAEARLHDRRARQAFRRGRYSDAIREYFLVQRVAPDNPRVAYNIALCFELLNEPREAFLAYTEYLSSLDPDDADEGRRARAEQSISRLSPRIARVEVESEPSGATIYVDSIESGAYGQSPRLVAVEPGERVIRFELEGYRPGAVTVRAVAGQVVRAEVELERIVGQLVVSAEPAGTAEVRDAAGGLVASGPTPLELSAPPGPYTVSVERAGYRVRREIVQIEEAQTATPQLRLEPLPAPTGSLTVLSTPPAAVVFVDDEPAGFTPLLLSRVTAGERNVRVEAPGQQPWSTDVTVDPDTPRWAQVTLESASAQRHSPATWVLGGTGIAALIGFAVVGGMAIRNRNLFGQEASDPMTDPMDLMDRRNRGQTLNAVSDALWIGGSIALGAALILFIVEEAQPARTSRGTVTDPPEELGL